MFKEYLVLAPHTAGMTYTDWAMMAMRSCPMTMLEDAKNRGVDLLPGILLAKVTADLLSQAVPSTETDTATATVTGVLTGANNI